MDELHNYYLTVYTLDYKSQIFAISAHNIDEMSNQYTNTKYLPVKNPDGSSVTFNMANVIYFSIKEIKSEGEIKNEHD